MRANALDIAIVGMASHFPNAASLYDFWTNVVDRRDSITDVDHVDGDEYWRKADFFDPNPAAADKTYGHKAGFVPNIRFDPVEFKLPPLMLESISTAQVFALYVARQAMQDAGLVGEGARPVDRDRIGVILGGAGNGNTSFSLAARQQAPYLRRIMVNAGLSEAVADDVIGRVKDLYLEWSEDSFPGFLGNVACGRIASYFDLGGTSYMVDAACASSLAAIKAAIGELADGSCDAVLSGGVNLENSVFSFMCFSKTPALSRSNRSRPFDAESDGMMLGDGVGFLVLKRLADAQRDGDRIYAVIKSVQASSDGRAKSIFAPRHEGQVKAMRRAYAQAGVSPADIQLVEAHGTGTQSGDQTEVRSLRAVFEACQVPEGSVAIGSIKSQIGHTRCAAGAAAMMKVALGLFHKVLPPTINVEQPSKDLVLGSSPFYVNTTSRPWFRPASGAPRRAALSAFGFGGTNFHAILEEHQPEPVGAFRLNRRAEVVTVHADAPARLLAHGQALLTSWQSDAGEEHFRRYQLQGGGPDIPQAAARLAFAAEDARQASKLLAEALKHLALKPDEDWEHPLGIFYKPRARVTAGRVVALFPGQGAQYVNMALELACDHPAMRQSLEALDAVARARGLPALSAVVYPNPVFTEQARDDQLQALTRTSRAQPAIGAVSAGYYRLLQDVGFVPDFLAGHSYGEVTALWAAGVFSDEDYYRVSVARGAAMESEAGGAPGGRDPGAMLAVPLPRDRVEELLRQFPELVVANHNAPEQVVLGGSGEAIRRAHARLTSQQVRAQVLQVAAAFHTPFVQHACAPFEASLRDITLQAPHRAVYSTATAAAYEQDPAAIRALLVRQLVSPVCFSQTIEAIHAAGGDLFVEIGPKGTLGKLVCEILKDRPHSVVSVNPSASADAALLFQRALAKLVVEGLPLRDLDRQAAQRPLPPPSKPGLVYTMSGGFFLSDKTRRKREQALRVDTRVVDAFVAGHPPAPRMRAAPDSATPVVDERATSAKATAATAHATSILHDQPSGWTVAAPTPTGVPNMNSGSMETGTLSALDTQVRAQTVFSQVHQQFQINQRDYIQLLDSLMAKQCSLLEKFQGSPQLSAVVSSLSQSFQLLDKSQELYHVNHGHYFDNQQALLGDTPRNGSRATAVAAQHGPLQALPPSLEPPTGLPSAGRAPEAPTPAEPVARAAGTGEPASSEPLRAKRHQAAARDADRDDRPVSSGIIPVHAPQAAAPGIPSASADAQVQESVPPAAAARVLSAEDQALVRRFEVITQEDLVKQIVAIVSDRTGYPEDMINEEMDLEADLGIDSIKRLEIFGAMFDKLSANVSYFQDAEKHKDMETFDIDAFSNIRKMAVFFKDTIAELLAHLKGKLPPPTQAAAPALPAATPLSALRETPLSEAAPLRNLGFVTSTRTLEEHSEPAAKKSIAESREDASAPTRRLNSSDADHETTAATKGGETAEPLRRSRPCLQALPRPDQRALDTRFGGTWLITDDGQGLSGEVAQRLLAQHQRVVRLLSPQEPGQATPETLKGVEAQVLSGWGEAALQSLLDRIAHFHGPIAGFIHLEPAARGLRSLDDIWSPADYARARGVFTLAKLLQPTFNRNQEGRSFFFVVTRLDGELGMAGRGLFPLATSGLTGLTKSLNAEWEGTFCRSIDIDPRVGPAEAAAMVLEELGDARTDIGEVGRTADGRRIGVDCAPAAADDRAPVAGIDPTSVFVVTGGARGITADCIAALAAEVPARFALLGRTRIDAPAPAWAGGASDVKALKAAAIAHLQAHGEQPTPVKVDRLLDEVLHAAEVRRTLQRVEQAGGRAIYVACNIADRHEVAAAIARAERELGPVTGLIHGAGNLADKRIEKKTDADFDRVFMTKVGGLECLLSALRPQQLRQLILFSSVSGFFGNAGQTDYAMANECLNKFAWMLQSQFPAVLVRSINWGPWDTGMVTEVLKKAYAQRGLVVIPGDAGVRHFVNEFRQSALRGATGQPLPQTLVGGDSYKVSPKVRQLPGLTRVGRDVRPGDNPFLRDHVVAGHPVLPATLAAGWMVQVCEDLLPGYRLEKLVDFRVLKGLVFDDAQGCRLVAEVRPVAEHGGTGERHALAVSVLSETGSTPLPRYEATLHLSRNPPAQPALGPAAAAASAPGEPGPSAIYGDMGSGALLFHGPTFQGLRALLDVGDRGLAARCHLDPVAPQRQGQFRVNSFNPYTADVLLQAPLAWLMLRSDEAGLPSHILSWEQFAPLAFDQTFRLSMQVTSRSRATLETDIAAHDLDGRLLARISALTFTVSGKLRETLRGEGRPDLAAAA